MSSGSGKKTLILTKLNLLRQNILKEAMKPGKKNLIIISMTSWLVILIIFTVLSSIINLEILFVLWLIGLLVILELSDSVYLQPHYIRYIKSVAAVGVIVFFIIVALKVMEIIGK